MSPNLPQDILHLHVSQSVDQRVEHMSDDCVEKSKNFIFWIRDRWSNIYEKYWHKKTN